MPRPEPPPSQPDLLGEAVTAFLRADHRAAADLARHHLARHPLDAEALNLLGASQLGQARWAEAIAPLQAALRLHPTHVDALNNLGLALMALGRRPEALPLLRQALALQPTHRLAFRNLVEALSAEGRHRELVLTALEPCFAHAFDAHADEIAWAWLQDAVWDVDPGTLLPRLHDAMQRQADRRLLTLVPLVLWDEPALHRTVARQFAARAVAASSGSNAPTPAHPGAGSVWPTPAAGRLRIGYLASGFRNHVVGYLCGELLDRHDRTCYEVVGYFAAPPDAVGQHLRDACDRHREVVQLSDAALAAQIRRDGIDILIECDGLANRTRIAVLALRPAPLQIHFLDYPGPQSAPGLDYTVVDRHVVPPGEEGAFDEAVLALPHTYHPFDTRSYRPEPAPRAALGWPEGAVVFGALSNSHKLTPAAFDTRLRILRQVPGAVLVQVRPSAFAEATLRARWAAAGLAPQRLILVDALPHGLHLERLAQVDLCLDSFPFASGTGAMEALWCDVPLLTRAGRSIASRNAASILITHGVPELVTHSEGEFEARAVHLGTHPGELRMLKQRLAALRARSPLFDMPRFTRTWEAGLEMAWARHRAGLPPARIDVPAPGA